MVAIASGAADSEPGARPAKPPRPMPAPAYVRASVLPAVEECIDALSREIVELMRTEQPAASWDFDPLEFLAAALKARSSTRDGLQLRGWLEVARDLAEGEAEPDEPGAPGAPEPPAPAPYAEQAAEEGADGGEAELATPISEEAAAMIAEMVEDGAIFTAGTGVRLLSHGGGGSDVGHPFSLTLPPPPAALSHDEWLRAPHADLDFPGLARPAPLPSCRAMRMSRAELERWLVRLGRGEGEGAAESPAADGAPAGPEPPTLHAEAAARLWRAFVARSEHDPSLLATLLPPTGPGAAPLLGSLCLHQFRALPPADAPRLAEWLGAHGAGFSELLATPAWLLADKRLGQALAALPALAALEVGALPAGEGGAPSGAWRGVGAVVRRSAALRALRLSHAPLSPADARELARAVAASAAVDELALESCAHAGGGGGSEEGRCAALLGALAPALRSPRLSSLSLRGTRLGDGGGCLLAGALPHAPLLARLDLGHTELGPDGALALAAALVCAPSLASLDLSMAAALPLAPMLALARAAGAAPALASLRWRCGAPLAAVRHRLLLGSALAAALGSSASLRAVCLAGQRLCLTEGEAAEEAAAAAEVAAVVATAAAAAEAETVAEAAEAETEARADPAAGNDEAAAAQAAPAAAAGAPEAAEPSAAAEPAEPEDAAEAAEAAAAAPLRLPFPLLPARELPAGARALNSRDALRQARLGLCWQRALPLRAHSAVAELDLSDACLRGAAVAALACALRGCAGLRTLELSGNGVGGACGSLAELLRSHTGLVSLRLARAALSGACLRALAPALSASASLTSLDLSDNGALGGGYDPLSNAEAGVAELADALAANGALRCLRLAGCGLGAELRAPPPSQERLDAAAAAREAAEAAEGAHAAATPDAEPRSPHSPDGSAGLHAPPALARSATSGGKASGLQAPPAVKRSLTSSSCKEAPLSRAELAAAAAAAASAREAAERLAGPPLPSCELLLAALGRNGRSALETLDLARNPLRAAEVAALCRLLPAAASLRELLLRGSLCAPAHRGLAAAVRLQGGLVLCDLHTANSADEPAAPHAPASAAPDGEAARAGGVAAVALGSLPIGGAPQSGADDDGGGSGDGGGPDASVEAVLAMERHMGADLPLLRALQANRCAHGLGWERLLRRFPEGAAAAVRRAFVLHSAAGADGVRVADLLAVLGSAGLRTLSPLCHSHTVPFGGFVQWVADYFFDRWRSPSDDFWRAMGALEAAVTRPISAAAAQPSAWHAAPILALLGGGRRYAQPPLDTPLPPRAEEAAKLAASAAQALGVIVAALGEAAEAEAALAAAGGGGAPAPADAPAADPPAADAPTDGAPADAPAAVAAHDAPPPPMRGPPLFGRPPPAAVLRPPPPPSAARAKRRLDRLCCAAYAPLVPALDEPLHVEAMVGSKSHVRGVDDLLNAYKLELLGKLRIALPGGGSGPDGSAEHERERCEQDDYGHWADALPPGGPNLPAEWLALATWVSESTPSVLQRVVAALDDGRPLIVREALFERPFEAGSLRLALTRVDDAQTQASGAQAHAPAEASEAPAPAEASEGEALGSTLASAPRLVITASAPLADGEAAATEAAAPAGAAEKARAGPWLISALRVAVRPGWVPADALHTWHDTPPFKPEEPPQLLPTPARGSPMKRAGRHALVAGGMLSKAAKAKGGGAK